MFDLYWLSQLAVNILSSKTNAIELTLKLSTVPVSLIIWRLGQQIVPNKLKFPGLSEHCLICNNSLNDPFCLLYGIYGYTLVLRCIKNVIYKDIYCVVFSMWCIITKAMLMMMTNHYYFRVIHPSSHHTVFLIINPDIIHQMDGDIWSIRALQNIHVSGGLCINIWAFLNFLIIDVDHSFASFFISEA